MIGQDLAGYDRFQTLRSVCRVCGCIGESLGTPGACRSMPAAPLSLLTPRDVVMQRHGADNASCNAMDPASMHSLKFPKIMMFIPNCVKSPNRYPIDSTSPGHAYGTSKCGFLKGMPREVTNGAPLGSLACCGIPTESPETPQCTRT